jgi:hypothetical protein
VSPRYEKDRAKPFDRKHRRYWLTTAGGMVLIMAVNVGLGVAIYNCDAEPPPPAKYQPIPPSAVPVDAGVDSLPDHVER